MTAEPGQGRDYLAEEILVEVEEHTEPDATRYAEVADLLRGMAGDDRLCLRINGALVPYLEDDARLAGTVYPGGQGLTFLCDVPPPADLPGQRLWSESLVSAVEADRRQWDLMVSQFGSAARWPDWNCAI